MTSLAPFLKELPRLFTEHSEPERVHALVHAVWRIAVVVSLAAYVLSICWGTYTLVATFRATAPQTSTRDLPPPSLDRALLQQALDVMKVRADVYAARGVAPTIADPSR